MTSGAPLSATEGEGRVPIRDGGEVGRGRFETQADVLPPALFCFSFSFSFSFSVFF
jgi:hypothetical protein